MTARIGFTGDLMCHAGFVVQEGEGMPFREHFSPAITSLCQSHNELWGNLEGPVSPGDDGLAAWQRVRKLPRSPYPKLFFPEGYLPFLWELGFRVLGIANNHSFDFETANDTIATTRVLTRLGFAVAGCDFTPVVRHVNDISFAIFATTSLLNPPHMKGPVAYLTQHNLDTLCAQIKRWRREVDYVTVMTHWGWDYVNRPTSAVRDLAGRLSDAGAKIIYGNHPHILWPIERTAPDRIVIFSLGNFSQVFGARPSHPKYRLFRQALHGGVLSLSITRDRITPSFQPTFAWQNFEAWLTEVPAHKGFWFWDDADVAQWWPVRKNKSNPLRCVIHPFGAERSEEFVPLDIEGRLGLLAGV